MSLNSYLVSIACSFIFLPSLSWGECLYCDSWRAFDGNPYFFESIATLNESTIALPSCETVAYKTVGARPSKSYGETCTDHFLELKAVPKCTRIKQEMLKPFVLVTACPKTPWGNEELEIDMRYRPEHSRDATLDFFGASWRLIRKSYDPCDSGGGHGQWMCIKFQREEAEEQLVALSKERSKAGHQKWIRDRDKACSEKGNGLSESWSYESEERCKLSKTWERTSYLRQQHHIEKK